MHESTEISIRLSVHSKRTPPASRNTSKIRFPYPRNTAPPKPCSTNHNAGHLPHFHPAMLVHPPQTPKCWKTSLNTSETPCKNNLEHEESSVVVEHSYVIVWTTAQVNEQCHESAARFTRTPPIPRPFHNVLRAKHSRASGFREYG
jgi:hypothetical protein